VTAGDEPLDDGLEGTGTGPGGAGGINLGLESVKGLLAKLVQAVLGFAGTILFARILGPTSFGGFYFLLSIVTVSTRPIAGFGNAVRKRFSEQGAPRSEILGSVGLFNLASLTVVAVAAVLLGRRLSRQTNIENATLVFLLLFVATGVFVPVQRLLGAAGHPALQVWNDTLRSILTLPLQLGLVLAGAGAAGMGYGLAGATLLTIPVTLFVLGLRPVLPARSTLGSIWEYARYSMPTSLVGTAYGRFDVLVLGAFLTTAAVGHYEVAYKLTVPATFVTTALGSALMPKVSNLHSRGEEFAQDITNALAYNSVLAIPLFFGASALARELVVTIYGGQYAPAGDFLVGLALYQVLATQAAIYQRTISGVDRPDLELRIDGATLAFNVVVGIALLFTVGALGVVVATVLAEFLRLLISIRVATSLVSGIEALPRPLLEQVGSGTLMFVVVALAHRLVEVRSWPDLAVLVGLGAAIYGLTLLAVSGHFRNTIRSIYRDAIA
jgi:O-antigen/teichoic acid export membrane protein